MNKLIILLLAVSVCLVSVHGFVKRETPGAQDADTLESIKKFGDGIKKTLEGTFNPENFQKHYNEFINTSQKFIGSLAKQEAPKN